MHGQTFRPMLMSDGRPNGGGLGSRARDHHEPELLSPKKLLKRSEREASLDVVRAFADDVIRRTAKINANEFQARCVGAGLIKAMRCGGECGSHPRKVALQFASVQPAMFCCSVLPSSAKHSAANSMGSACGPSGSQRNRVRTNS